MIKADARRDDIARYIIEQGSVRIDNLIAHFGVSRMTVHRHIDRLAEQGILRKQHGAVTAQPSNVYESAHRYRATIHTDEKQALARAALDYVTPGQVVMLDDSTTANTIAPMLLDIPALTVISNSVSTANLLTAADSVDFLCLGGQYHRTYHAYIGLLCEQALSGLRANLLICSASAVTGTMAFIQDPQVVRVKQAMMKAAAKRILLLDHSKFGRDALHAFETLTAFDAVLVTDGIGDAAIRSLEEAGAPLRIVRTVKP